jgi:hypothetical protein
MSRIACKSITALSVAVAVGLAAHTEASAAPGDAAQSARTVLVELFGNST